MRTELILLTAVVLASMTAACTRRAALAVEAPPPAVPDASPSPAAPDAMPDTRPPLPPEIRDWSLSIEVGSEAPRLLPGDAYQLLDDDDRVVRSIPMLLCAKGAKGKGVPAHTLVACRKKREAGSFWWRFTFQKIDYNKSYTLVAHFDPKHGAGGDQDLFAHRSPRQIDDANR